MASLPQALKLTKFPREDTMTINTVVVQPQIAANNFVRYVLERRGILDSNSVFTFALKRGPTNTAVPVTLPVKTGISALIKNCTLRLGNQVISRTQDWAHYDTIDKMFSTCEERSLKHYQTKGTLSTLRPSLHVDGHLGLKDAVYSSTKLAVTPPMQDISKDPLFMIKLSELFPALKDVQLPLGHMNANMVLEFELNEQPDGVTHVGTLATFPETYTGNTEILPDYTQMTMLADHLSYSDRTHAEIDDLIKGNGLVIPFHEVVTIQSVVPAAASQPSSGTTVAQTHNQELALVGRTVKGVLVAESVSQSQPGMLGAYKCVSPHVSPRYNIKVNDLNIYPREIVDPSVKVTELEKVFGRPLAANVSEYSFEVSGDGSVDNKTTDAVCNKIIGSTDEKFNGRAYDLEGGAYVEGLDLTRDPFTRRGTFIDSKPILYQRQLTRTNEDYEQRECRFFCLVEKSFAVKNGDVAVMA